MGFYNFEKVNKQHWHDYFYKELKSDVAKVDLLKIKTHGIEIESYYEEKDVKHLPINEINDAQKRNAGWSYVESITFTNMEFDKIRLAYLQSIGCETVKVQFSEILSIEQKVEFIDLIQRNEMRFLLNPRSNKIKDKTIDFESNEYYSGNILSNDLEGKDELESISKLIQNLNKIFENGESMTHKPIVLEALISPDFLFSIAKLRALRYLALKVSAAYNSKREIKILGKTNERFYENDNEHINIVRATTMSLSALIGGCDYIEIVNFDKKESEFSSRISKNISELIKEESYFGKVSDPLAGSYFLEVLTYKIILKLWADFTNNTKKKA